MSLNIDIPKDRKLFDNRTSIGWIDDEGIFVSHSKKVSKGQTLEEFLTSSAEFKEFVGIKKVLLMAFIDNAQPAEKDVRDSSVEIMSATAKAFAMVGTKTFARMVVNIYFGLKPPTYPVKMFATEEEARKWLRKYK